MTGVVRERHKIIAGAIIAIALIMVYLVKATGTLRVSQAGEEEGIDYHEHGANAYA